MKLRKKAFVSFTCALALAGNSVGVLAQDKAQQKTQTQSQVQRKVVVTTADGQTQEFNVESDGTVFVGPDGKKAQVTFSTSQNGSFTNVQGQVVTSQDGQNVKVIKTPDGKEVKIVTSQNGDGNFNWVVEPNGQGAAVFRSQDGTVHNFEGQNFTFVRGGNGQDFTYNFISSEMGFDNKLVKGAPFVADIENETVKTLADGNRIVHKNSGSIARDSEGRTRRETTISAIGSPSGGEPPKTVTINDPVAGTMFMLEPQSKTARKMGNIRMAAPLAAPTLDAPKRISVSGGTIQGSAIKRVQPTYPSVAKAAKASGAVQVQITISEEGKVIDAVAISGHPLLRDAALEAARQWEFKPTELSGKPVKVQSTLTFNFTLAGEENTSSSNGESNQMMKMRMPEMRMPAFNTNTESLGKQTIEGIEVEGKRSVTTIPVGAIGNERPIEIVSESWYSPELQTTIMSKRTDPTSGETTYRLVNIRRAEPDASLFQVPSDYTVKEGGFGVGTGFGMGVGAGGTFEVAPTMRKRTSNQ
ncbi:MAG: energy transducer TonB [Acidobacteria bacterium]|nr:energy transducer TonB [Acidobacteriota bacterium]